MPTGGPDEEEALMRELNALDQVLVAGAAAETKASTGASAFVSVAAAAPVSTKLVSRAPGRCLRFRSIVLLGTGCVRR